MKLNSVKLETYYSCLLVQVLLLNSEEFYWVTIFYFLFLDLVFSLVFFDEVYDNSSRYSIVDDGGCRCSGYRFSCVTGYVSPLKH